jgi:hypothetical protein
MAASIATSRSSTIRTAGRAGIGFSGAGSGVEPATFSMGSLTDERKPLSAMCSSNDVDASSPDTARLQLGAASVGQDHYALVVVLDEPEVAEDLLRPADARLCEDRRRRLDHAQLTFERPDAERVTALAAKLAKSRPQMPSDAPLHRDPANPTFDGEACPLALRGVPQREQVHLARIEVLRAELEVAVGVLVDAAREERQKDDDALLRDLLELCFVVETNSLEKAAATMALPTEFTERRTYKTLMSYLATWEHLCKG